MVTTETKILIDYVFVVAEKSLKKYRYSFVTRIHNIQLDIIKLLYEDNSIIFNDDLRCEKTKKAVVKFQLLDYM